MPSKHRTLTAHTSGAVRGRLKRQYPTCFAEIVFGSFGVKLIECERLKRCQQSEFFLCHSVHKGTAPAADRAVA